VINCDHAYERVKVRQERYVGFRRRCRTCLREEIWRLKEEPGPDNAGDLGEWELAPNWIKDMEFWSK